MKTQLHILASGSKANSYLLETNNGNILIDQGLSFKKFKEKSEKLKIDINKTKLILVTHEHTDHISGVFLTAKKLKIPVFTSFGTAQKLKEKDKYGINIQFIDKNKKYTEFGFSFVAFPVFHDAVDPVGFALQLKNKEIFTIATDTGRITTSIMRYLKNSTSVILEANHDRQMLMKNQKYSWDLKQRIKGNQGHLSNEQTFETLKMMSPNLKNVILAHLSEENNSVTLVKNLACKCKKEQSLSFNPFVATQHKPFTVRLI
jgi:phosphoribosyl 1,2-cyclic phosphodiesterase